MANVKSSVALPSDCIPMCDATVDLISRVYRPYLFKVTVTGKPPHAMTRWYEIQADTDGAAAMAGIAKFVKEMSHPMRMLDSLTLVPAE